MHIVYEIVFPEREKNEIYPCSYIGSKSNVTIVNNIMYGINKKPYWGSSNDVLYKKLIKTEEKKIYVHKRFEDYNECLTYENYLQVCLEVKTSIFFFNKSYATEKSNYTNPNYATYKHYKTGKYIRLPRDDTNVKNGTYVGTTKNVYVSEEVRNKYREMFKGKKNPFYGKHHTKETIDKIKKTQDQWKIDNEIKYNEFRHNASDRMRLMSKGIPKSDKFKQIISKNTKNRAVFKNLNTGKTKRFDMLSQEYLDLDRSIWVSCIRYATINKTAKKLECKYCGMISNVTNINRWHNDNCKHKENKMKIASIKEVGIKDVYDISVDVSESYVLENGVITHNTGGTYASNTVWIIGKNQLKEKEGVTGSNFIIKCDKSRYVKERSQFPITVRYNEGIAKWSGLAEVAEAIGIITPERVSRAGGYAFESKTKGKLLVKAIDIDMNDDFWETVIAESDFVSRLEKSYSFGTSDKEIEIIPEKDISQELLLED